MKKEAENIYKLSQILTSANTKNIEKQILKALNIIGEITDAYFIILTGENGQIFSEWVSPKSKCNKILSKENIAYILEKTLENKSEKSKQTILCNKEKTDIYIYTFKPNKELSQIETLIFSFPKDFKRQKLLKQVSNLIFKTLERVNKEIELIEENTKLKILLNSIPDIVCFKDKNGRWIEANKSDLKLFKLQGKNFKGKKDSELVEYSPFFKEAFLTCELTDQIAMQKKKKSRSIEEIPQPNGTTKIFDVFKIPILNKDKSIKGLIVYGRDITRERKIEENLQKQLTYSEKIISIAEYILKKQNKKEIMGHIVNELGKTLSLDQCYVFEYNAITSKISPIASWKKTNNNRFLFRNKFSADYVKKLLEHFKKKRNIIESYLNKPNIIISSTGLDKTLHKQLKIKSLFIKPLLYTYPYMLFLSGLSLSKENKLGKFEKNFINTVSKLVEVEVMKSAFLDTIQLNLKEISKLASMIEQAQEIFVLTDIKGKIEYVNPQFEKTTGYSNYETIGKSTKMLKSGKHPKEFYKQLWKTIKQGHKWEGKIINKKKNGEPYIERAIIYPIKNLKGEITKFCKIARDITKETILEERLRHAQKMEALATLARGMAHDFNNIITTILMNTNMAMLYSKENKELNSYIENINLAAGTASDIVEKILSFAKEGNTERKLIDFNETIKNSIKLLLSVIPPNITFKSKIPNSKYLILGNEGEIHQVFMNICNNAIQAIGNKKGRIEVNINKIIINENFLTKHPGVNLIKDKEYIKLTIKDTGKGIPEEIRNKIFEPYFTTKGEKGTGLGLSIVHGIIRSYNGEILLDTEKGKGTTFEIYFPI